MRLSLTTEARHPWQALILGVATALGMVAPGPAVSGEVRYVEVQSLLGQMYDAVISADDTESFGLSIPRGTALPRRMYPVRNLGVPMIQELRLAQYQNVLLRYPQRAYTAYLEPNRGSSSTANPRPAAIILTEDTSIPAGDPTYEGLDLVVDGCTMTLSGTHMFNSLWVVSGGVMTPSPAPNGEPTSPIDLTIAAELIVDSSSRVDLSGHGYAAGQGPGRGDYLQAGAGAGYGGLGGSIDGLPGGRIYGSPTDPLDVGSGGGGDANGGSGGGALRLVVADLQVEGSLLANGLNGGLGGGGGSGGCINLRVGSLGGGGLIQANGGGAGFDGGGGGGGRIAVRYGSDSFFGSFEANGGSGIGSGEPGTVYLERVTIPPILVAGYHPAEGILMSWPVSIAGVVLEATTALAGDEVSWETIPESLYQTSGQMILYFDPIGPSDLKLFRLRWP